MNSNELQGAKVTNEEAEEGDRVVANRDNKIGSDEADTVNLANNEDISRG